MTFSDELNQMAEDCTQQLGTVTVSLVSVGDAGYDASTMTRTETTTVLPVTAVVEFLESGRSGGPGGGAGQHAAALILDRDQAASLGRPRAGWRIVASGQTGLEDGTHQIVAVEEHAGGHAWRLRLARGAGKRASA